MRENKVYRKPDYNIMKFTLSESVATSGCTSSSTSTTTYTQQEITCIIDGSEYVFYSGCSNNVSSGYLGTYDGQTYFVWYDGNVESKPTSEQQEKLTAIEKAVGASSAIGQPGWHAGVASATITTIFNSSY